MSAIEVDSPPPWSTIPEPLVGALHELAAARRLLVALDFDGTIAPFVDDPSQSRPLPNARDAVLALAGAARTRVALVSGRALDSLRDVADFGDSPAAAEILMVGSHGAEPGPGAGPTRTAGENGHGADAIPGEALERLGTVLRAVVDDFSGAWVEPKRHGYAVHVRLADDQVGATILARCDAAVAAEFADVRVTRREGKDVREFALSSTTKGDALEALRQQVDADAVFFAGDDVTDEDGFEVLGADDVGIKVGAGTTAAGFRVPDLPSLVVVLERLARFRAGDVHEQ